MTQLSRLSSNHHLADSPRRPRRETAGALAILTTALLLAHPGWLAAGNDDYFILEDSGAFSDNVRANDPGVAYVILNTGPSGGEGTLSFLNSDGSFSFTPAPDFCNPSPLFATFTYGAFDASDNILAIYGVYIHVTCVNDAPSFNKGPNQTTSSASLVTVPGWATAISMGPANESGQSVSSFLVTTDKPSLFATQPAVGNTGTLTFTAAHGPNGTANVTVRLQDNGGTANGGVDTSAPQTFTITNTVNDAPVAVNDGTYTTAEDTSLPVATGPGGILDNDGDVDGDSLTVSVLTPPSHGTLDTFNTTNGAFTYTPAADYNGPDSFTYEVSDGVLSSGPATVSFTVTPVNDPPVASVDAYVVNEDHTLNVSAGTGVLANDTDVDLDTLGAVLDSAISTGTLTLNGDGSFTYVPNADYYGNATFAYRASDGHGGLSSVTVVTITVNPVNDAPSFVKGPDQHIVGGAATAVANWATSLSRGPANESAQTLSFTLVAGDPALFTTQPAVSPTGTLTFDPAPNANGVTTVTVTLSDSGGTDNDGVDTSASQTFSIRVTDLIVNSANDVDDGVCNATHCSLREAINYANVSPNLGGLPDTIHFAIPGSGTHTIAVLSPLPAVAEPVNIYATSQPGYAATPLIELDGTLAGLSTPGLRLGAGATAVGGFAINRFEGHGIVITGPGGNSVFNNFIGTDPSGLVALPNGGSGLRIAGSTGNEVWDNVLSGNGGSGVRLEAGANSNYLGEDNRIGVGADGTTSLPNGDSGIYILGGSSNVIEYNTIARNGTNGVQVASGEHNTIRYNSIKENTVLGIELGSDGVTANDPGDPDTGANGLQNYPVLTRATASATETGVSGTFSGKPNTTFTLDYYVNDSCDPSGFGEGATILGTTSVTTNASGEGVIAVAASILSVGPPHLPPSTPGKYLTATASSPSGDTSEFSACRKIDPLPTLVLTGGETGGVLQINEGNPTAGPPTQAVTFLAQLSAASALPVAVNHQTADGTAQSPSDYLTASGSLLFTPGETFKQIVVQTVLDNDPETDETFTISLGVPTNAVRGQSSILVVLKDDDGAEGPLALSVSDAGVSEPRAGSRPAVFTVSLADPAFHTVWVNYGTQDGTAKAGLDYTAASGQLVFQPGDETKTVSVNVLADALREDKETFYLILTGPQGAILGRGQGTALIADPGAFSTLAPCRLFDSRSGSGAFIAGELRTLTMRGTCGVSTTAVAVSANITVVDPAAPGFVEAFPADKIAPPTSVVNFAAGQTRANNAIVVLSPDGKAIIKNVSTGKAHIIVDVNGYFE